MFAGERFFLFALDQHAETRRMRLKWSMKFGIAVSETRGRLMKFTGDIGLHRIALHRTFRFCLYTTTYNTIMYHTSHLTQLCSALLPCLSCTIDPFVNVPCHFIGTVWKDQIKSPCSRSQAPHSLYSKKLRKCIKCTRQKHHDIHAMAMDRAKQKTEQNKTKWTPKHQFCHA